MKTKSTVWLQIVSYIASGDAFCSRMSFLKDRLVDLVDDSICVTCTCHMPARRSCSQQSVYSVVMLLTSPIRDAFSICALEISSERLCRFSICENALATCAGMCVIRKPCRRLEAP